MKVISVLNQKGGVGKTTIATNLARALQLPGMEVLLIDSDPQGSSSDWSAAKENQPVPVIAITRPTIERDLKSVSHKKDYIVIDGCPQTSDMAVSAIKAADLVLIPVQPSPWDIWATSDLVDMVKQRIEITEGKLKTAFVVSRAIRNTKLSKEVVEALQDYQLPILVARTHNLTIYSSCVKGGGTVFDEDPDCSAAKEISDIAREIIDILK